MTPATPVLRRDYRTLVGRSINNEGLLVESVVRLRVIRRDVHRFLYRIRVLLTVLVKGRRLDRSSNDQKDAFFHVVRQFTSFEVEVVVGRFYRSLLRNFDHCISPSDWLLVVIIISNAVLVVYVRYLFILRSGVVLFRTLLSKTE